jgi:hypothetical protein
MRASRIALTIGLSVCALGLLASSCNDPSGSVAEATLHSSALQQGDEDGFTLTADPAPVVIDLNDAATPVDQTTGKHYGETTLTATALDDTGQPQAGLPITFTTTAGTLASAGQPVMTDASGIAHDTLRLFEDSPASTNVTATDGSRTETLAVALTVVQVNATPVADAGDDMTVECTSNGGTAVRLDGSGSTDADNDIVLYEWFLDFGLATETKLGEGVQLDTTLALGVHTITLRVTDSQGATATDEVVVTIQDTTPPEVSMSLDPTTLWPPNHKMRHVTATVTVLDCGPTTTVLSSLESSESANGTGDGNTEPDMSGAAIGTEDYEFDLRSERAGPGSGRVYTVVYTVTDSVGLSTEATAEVRAPHDQGH